MTTFRKCSSVDGSVDQIVTDMVDKYHGELRDAGVTFELLFAYADRDDNEDAVGPALKLHGYPCAAVIKIVSYKDRVLGHADAQIVIDGDRWDEWSEDEKAALIDHEITHIELKVDGNNVVVRDDVERPKLRMRNHDHQFGWFDCVARRHGKASFEIQQADKFVSESYRQLWLPYMDTQSKDVPVADSTRRNGGGRRAAASR